MNNNYSYRFFALIILLFVTTLQASAKIWRVNNNEGVKADFTTLQLAISSPLVMAGDTLHLESSPSTYNSIYNVNLTKRLVILGTGYFLDQNPKTQANLNASTVHATVTPRPAISLDASSSGSVLMGLDIQQIYLADASNIVISRNNIKLIILNPFESFGVSNNVLISDNFIARGENTIDQSGIITAFATSYVTYTNLRIENNIIIERLKLPFVASGQIINNYIGDNFSVANCLVKNNFIGSTATKGSNVFEYNIFQNSNSLTGSNGNFVAAANSVFNAVSMYQDAGFQLKPTSPAIGAGRDALNKPINIGPFGGGNPYVLSGMPPIPSIYSLTVPQNVPDGTSSMNVILSTISRN